MSESTPLRAQQLKDISDVHIRHGFIQKVYGILGSQLVVTTGLSALIMKAGEGLVKSSPGLVLFLLFGSMAASVGMMCVFMCCPNTMRKVPLNYILLFAFTVAESIMVGFICIQYTQESVLIAVGITALVVVSLTVFACQTSVDFTGFGPYLFCALMVLMGFGFVLCIASWVGAAGSAAFETMRLIYAALGALIFSMYIVFDTQLIVGGKHKMQFSIDDYCMAAISLYLDIIQLFLFLLQLFGERR